MTEAQKRQAIEKAAELIVFYMKTYPNFDKYEHDSIESYKEVKELFDQLLLDKVCRLYPEFHDKWKLTLKRYPYL